MVLGASRGIGKGVALEAALGGAVVYVTGRTVGGSPGDGAASLGSLAETVADIRAAGGHAVAVPCDATDDGDLARLFAQVEAEQGRLDLLVHSAFNSSAFGPTIGRPSWELPVRLWDDLLFVGARSAYAFAVSAAPVADRDRRRAGGQHLGPGRGRYRYNAAYGIDKAAIDKLTADLAHELRPHGVAVVSLWPSVTRTERNRAVTGVDEYGWPDPDQIGRRVGDPPLLRPGGRGPGFGPRCPGPLRPAVLDCRAGC